MKDFSIEALWGPRPEEPEQIARSIKSLVAQLRPITPEFARWYQVISDDNVPELDDTETWLASVVASDVVTGDLGEPIPYLGYISRTTNDPWVFSNRIGKVSIGTHAGSQGAFNCVTVMSGNPRDLPLSLLTYPIVKQTVLALSKAFSPLWTSAGPHCLEEGFVRSRYMNNPVIPPCWMIHLSPPLARRVAPPPGIIGERYDDGSLFLSATDRTFDPDKADHVAAAHRLFAILDTLQEKKPRDQWLY